MSISFFSSFSFRHSDSSSAPIAVSGDATLSAPQPFVVSTLDVPQNGTADTPIALIAGSSRLLRIGLPDSDSYVLKIAPEGGCRDVLMRFAENAVDDSPGGLSNKTAFIRALRPGLLVGFFWRATFRPCLCDISLLISCIQRDSVSIRTPLVDLNLVSSGATTTCRATLSVRRTPQISTADGKVSIPCDSFMCFATVLVDFNGVATVHSTRNDRLVMSSLMDVSTTAALLPNLHLWNPHLIHPFVPVIFDSATGQYKFDSQRLDRIGFWGVNAMEHLALNWDATHESTATAFSQRNFFITVITSDFKVKSVDIFVQADIRDHRAQHHTL